MITLEYTSSIVDSISDSIQLPNPILGDSEQMDIGTVFQISMAKTVHSTRKDAHSKLLLNFVDVKQEVFEAFKLWYQGARGLLITYTDYGQPGHPELAMVWSGIITNNSLDIVVMGRKVYSTSDGDWDEVANFTIELEVTTI